MTNDVTATELMTDVVRVTVAAETTVEVESTVDVELELDDVACAETGVDELDVDVAVAVAAEIVCDPRIVAVTNTVCYLVSAQGNGTMIQEGGLRQ